MTETFQSIVSTVVEEEGPLEASHLIVDDPGLCLGQVLLGHEVELLRGDPELEHGLVEVLGVDAEVGQPRQHALLLQRLDSVLHHVSVVLHLYRHRLELLTKVVDSFSK